MHEHAHHLHTCMTQSIPSFISVKKKKKTFTQLKWLVKHTKAGLLSNKHCVCAYACSPHQSSVLLSLIYPFVFVCLLPPLFLLPQLCKFSDSSYLHHKSSINGKKYNYCDRAYNAGHGHEKQFLTGGAWNCHMRW